MAILFGGTRVWLYGHKVSHTTCISWAKAWDHVMYQQSYGLSHFTSTGQPSTTGHQDMSLLLPLLAAKGCGSHTCQGCSVDKDDDPLAVPGCALFCRDISVKVAGNGPTDLAVLQLFHSLLAAGRALLVLCCAEPGRKVTLLPPCDPHHPPHAKNSCLCPSGGHQEPPQLAMSRKTERAALPRRGNSSILTPAAPGGKGAHLAKLGKSSLASALSLPQSPLGILQTSYARGDLGPTGAKMAPGCSEGREVTLQSSTEALSPKWP